MAVKIFCNMCQKFIRDAKPVEIPNLRGTEVCAECEKKTGGLIEAMQKTSDRAIKQINDTLSKAKADLEEMKRRVIEGDKKNGTDT